MSRTSKPAPSGPRAFAGAAGKAAAAGTGKHIADKWGPNFATHAGIWVMYLLVFILGVLLHLRWQWPADWLWVGLVGAASAALTWFAWVMTSERSWLGQGHLVMTVAYIGGWTTAAAGWGIRGVRFDTWLIGWALILSWNIRLAVRPDTLGDLKEDASGGSANPRARAWFRGFAQRHELRAFWRAKDEPERNRITGPVQGVPGEFTPDDLQKLRSEIASEHRVGLGAITIVPDPDDNSRVKELTVMKTDILKAVHTNDDPTRNAGKTLFEALPIGGVSADGRIVRVPLITPNGAVHWMVMGMTRAGKTEWFLTLAADLLTRPAPVRDAAGRPVRAPDGTPRLEGVVQWASDTVKGDMSFGRFPGLFDWVAGANCQDRREAIAQTRQMLVGLRALVPVRARKLAALGLANWEPGHANLPAIVVYLDEAGDFVGQSELFDKLASQVAALGISMVAGFQRSHHKKIDTNARANFAGRVCFGVQDPEDADFVLSERTIKAGADPSWGVARPGCHYLEGPTVPLEEAVTPNRGLLTPADILSAVMARYRPQALPDDEAAAIGEAYTGRTVGHLPAQTVHLRRESDTGPAPSDTDLPEDRDTMRPIDPDIEPYDEDTEQELVAAADDADAELQARLSEMADDDTDDADATPDAELEEELSETEPLVSFGPDPDEDPYIQALDGRSPIDTRREPGLSDDSLLFDDELRGPGTTPAEAKAAMTRWLHERLRSAEPEFSIGDLLELAYSLGRSRWWPATEIKRRLEAGEVTRYTDAEGTPIDRYRIEIPAGEHAPAPERVLANGHGA